MQRPANPRPPASRRRSGTRAALALLGLTLTLLIAPAQTPAAAQDRYELDDGTWQPTSTIDIDTPEGQLQVAQRVLADNRPQDAQRLADLWIDTHPNHPLMADARMLRGDAMVMRGRYYEALFDYEHVIRVYPESPQYHRALEREYDIAVRFVEGTRRHLWGMRLLPAYSEGEELLIRIQERAPGSELGERASLRLAEFYYHRGEMADAAEAYDLFLLNYPQSDRREDAMVRLIQASLARVSGPAFDPTGLIEARERLRIYREEFPTQADRLGADALDARIDESMAAKDLRVARWHEQRGERVSAAYLYQRVAADYPMTAAADQAMDRLEELDLPVNPGLDTRGRQSTGADADVDVDEDAEDDAEREDGQ